MDGNGGSYDFRALTGFLLQGRTVGDSLQHVAQATVNAVASAEFAGVTMIVDGKSATGVFTDEVAPEIDHAQYESGHGPCIDAFRTGEVITIDSTVGDCRYPEFSAAAAEHGILSTLSLPLTVGGERLGALNLYSLQKAGFDEASRQLASQFALQAAVVLVNAWAYEQSVTLSDQYETAMKSRSTIDLARGILMASTRCTDERAFQRLVEQSQQTNTKLRVVAEAIVRNANRAAR